MMRWIVGTSLKFRRLVVALAAGLLILGVTQLDDMPRDVLPEFSPTIVEVQTEALGLSAAEVEQLITVPLEQDLLNGVAFLEEIRSASIPGLSSVVMTFEPGTDVLDARQVVQERLTQAVGAAGLPQVAKPPQMLQPLSSTSRVSMIRLSSDALSPIEMSVLARWVIGPRLLGVEGVANVAIWGQRERQLQVLVDPEQLHERGVTLRQIIRTAGNALEVSPLSFLEASTPGTGGFIDTVNQRLQIFHEQAISTPEELAQVPVEDDEGNTTRLGAQALTLGDVSTVVEDHQPLIGDALCREGQCLLLVVEKFPRANTLEVTRDLDAAIDALRPGLGGMEIDAGIYRPARFIEASVVNLGWALLIGVLLLLLVIGALLWDWRTGLISLTAIASSLAAAGLVLYLRGVTVNTMVLAGLVMALVVIIDDAIVDVDNTARRLRLHRAEGGGGAPVWRTILEASLEMRSALLYGSLLVVAALLPVFFMKAEAGAFLPPLALTYVLAVAASMLVALTLTPALGMLLLPGVPVGRRGSPVGRRLQMSYERLLPRILRRPRGAYAVFGAVVVVGLVTLPFLDTSMRPSLKDRDVLIDLEAASGTSLPRMDEVTTQAVEELASLPGIRDVGAHVGRAVMSDQIVNVNSGQIWVNLDPSADHDATLAAIEEVMDSHPEVSNDVLTYSEERITDVLRGTDDEIMVRIFGENSDVLSSKAEEVHGILSDIDGVETAEIEMEPQEPTVEVEVDLGRAQAFGVKPGDVRRSAAVLLSGITVGNLFETQKVFDVVVWGAPEIRQSTGDVRELMIDTPDGGQVALGEVADVRITMSPAVIRHESVSKFVDVSVDVAGRDVDAVAGDIDRALAQVEFPLAHHAELLGTFADQQAGRSGVLTIAIAAAIGIFLLLQAAFTSWRLGVLVFVTLPMALAGGLLGALLAGGTITLGSIAGLLAVLGIAARGGIVLIRRYRHLERHEGLIFGPELVRRGTGERFLPILATVLGAAVVLIPLVIAGGLPGLEIVGPMAVVILGGLVTSTLLTLVVLPAAYLQHGFISQPDTAGEELIVRVPEVDSVRRPDIDSVPG